MSNNKLDDILETLEAIDERQKFRKLDYYKPYPKQKMFHDLGLTKRERLLMAGNQLGKTYSAAAEVSMHATGEYPEWWVGRKFNHPVTIWVSGEGALLVRDGAQRLLCGKPGVEAELGSGLIPKESIADKPSLSRGVTDAYDTVQVTHKTEGIEDGVSTITFKSYEQGREKFQSGTVDIVWPDEEPPEDVYGEIMARITATKGMVLMTFTPLKGITKVVQRYLEEPSSDRSVVTMTIEEAEHFTPEERARTIAGYLKHEREARSKGIPLLGSGIIYTEVEENVIEAPIRDVPLHWAKIWGMDFGIGHPWAASLLLWDRDNDVVHVHFVVRMADALPIQHAVPMKTIGADVPIAWPQDGAAREKGSGDALSGLYKKQGLRMLPDHATFAEGGYSTEAAIKEIQDRESTARFKVSSLCMEYFEERRMYHRKDGFIVKLKDDILSATQKGIMMLRFAKPVSLGSKRPDRKQNGNMAQNVDFDVFN